MEERWSGAKFWADVRSSYQKVEHAGPQLAAFFSEFSITKEALARACVFMPWGILLLPYAAQVRQGSGPPAKTKWTFQV